MLCVTWNVAEARAEAGRVLAARVGELSGGCDIVAIALQEIETGGPSVALGVARDALAKSAQARSRPCPFMECRLRLPHIQTLYHRCYAIGKRKINNCIRTEARPEREDLSRREVKRVGGMWLQERGNSNAQAWQVLVAGALGPNAAWARVGLRQLSGMLIMVFARTELQVQTALALLPGCMRI